MKNRWRMLWSFTFIVMTASLFVSTYQIYVNHKNTLNQKNTINKYTEIEQPPELGLKKIAITFDDGPHPIYTEQLLDGLKEREVKATFFVTGSHAKLYPKLVERMSKEGHLIGNHTYSHLQLTKRNRKEFKEELIQTNEVIFEITGQEVSYVRPPYGSWDKTFEAELNMFPVLWDIDPLDWCSSDASCIVRNVIADAKENSIILMHDEYKPSVEAALQIVDELQEQGYTFVTVEEILFN